jgi:hypothetical protein
MMIGLVAQRADAISFLGSFDESIIDAIKQP